MDKSKKNNIIKSSNPYHHLKPSTSSYYLKKFKSTDTEIKEAINPIIAKMNERKLKRLDYGNVTLKSIYLDIIPLEYFGNYKNQQIFFDLIHLCTTQAKFECFHKSRFTAKYNLDVVPWLEEISPGLRMKMFGKANMYLLECVVKPIIRHYYQLVTRTQNQEICFVPKGLYKSFKIRAIKDAIERNYMKLAKDHKNDARGVLKFVAKKTCSETDYRPLLSYAPSKSSEALRLVSKKLFGVSNTKIQHDRSFYKGWKGFVEKVGDRQIYGAKVDLKDAFGNIDVVQLRELLNKYFESPSLRNLALRELDNQYIDIQFRKHTDTYEWTHGLVQGNILSVSLCDFYLACFEDEFLKASDFVGEIFLHRTVDDFIFCSVDPDDVSKFVQITDTNFELNDRKTQIYLDPGIDNAVINYSCHHINLATKALKKAYDFKANFEIRYRFKLWNYKKPFEQDKLEDFLLHNTKYNFVAQCFQKTYLSTHINKMRTVLHNVFEAMIYVAIKFVICLEGFADERQLDASAIVKVIVTTLKTFANRIFNKIIAHKGVHYAMGSVSVKKVVTIIAGKAFYLVLYQKQKYRGITKMLQDVYQRFIIPFNGDADLKYFKTDFNSIPKAFRKICYRRVGKV